MFLKKITEYDDETLLALQKNVINAYAKLKFPSQIKDYRSLVIPSNDQTKSLRSDNSTTTVTNTDSTSDVDTTIDAGAIWSLIRSIPKFIKPKIPV